MSIFSPVQSFLKASALKLSALDGNPGLSLSDFSVIVERVKIAPSLTNDSTEARRYVVDFVDEAFGHKIPAWTLQLITWLAYSFAKRKGWIP